MREVTCLLYTSIGDVAVEVRRDVHVVQPHLAVSDECEAVGELAVVVAQRAHLAPRELDAGLERLKDLDRKSVV